MSVDKSTRDICLEMKGNLDRYILESTARREICGKRFETCERKAEVANAKANWFSGILAAVQLWIFKGGH